MNRETDFQHYSSSPRSTVPLRITTWPVCAVWARAAFIFPKPAFSWSESGPQRLHSASITMRISESAMADDVVTDISVILWIHDREAITVRIDPQGMRMPVDNDLEPYREIALFEAFAFEPSQLEVSHPENIVKPATIILAQVLFGNV